MNVERLEDFTLLLFIYMACVDGSLHPNEREAILEKMNELFPDQSFQEAIHTCEQQYNAMGFQRAEILLAENAPRFSDIPAEQKNKIYAGLFDIINSDGKVSEQETKNLPILKGWIF
ncbi:MAG: TerB family tellurite resistance protein [Cyclobacteriaceae bacterium]|nr:TerB family tellurite resistance protein [Cyclobacteriaceae bacterium]